MRVFGYEAIYIYFFDTRGYLYIAMNEWMCLNFFFRRYKKGKEVFIKKKKKKEGERRRSQIKKQ